MYPPTPPSTSSTLRNAVQRWNGGGGCSEERPERAEGSGGWEEELVPGNQGRQPQVHAWLSYLGQAGDGGPQCPHLGRGQVVSSHPKEREEKRRNPSPTSFHLAWLLPSCCWPGTRKPARVTQTVSPTHSGSSLKNIYTHIHKVFFKQPTRLHKRICPDSGSARPRPEPPPPIESQACLPCPQTQGRGHRPPSPSKLKPDTGNWPEVLDSLPKQSSQPPIISTQGC